MTEAQRTALRGVLLGMQAALEGMHRLVGSALAILEDNPEAQSAIEKIRATPKVFGEPRNPEVSDGG